MNSKTCYNCRQPVTKDVVALNRKMLGHETRRLLCLPCLAEYLGCSEGHLRDLIEEFKEQGCTLFV